MGPKSAKQRYIYIYNERCFLFFLFFVQAPKTDVYNSMSLKPSVKTSLAAVLERVPQRCLICGPPMVVSMRLSIKLQLTFESISSTAPCLATRRGRLPNGTDV